MPENPNCAETYATLRIVGREVEPDAITQLIGIAPDFTKKPGSAPLGLGIWAIRSEGCVSSTCLEEHVVALLNRLATGQWRRRDSLDPGTRVEFHCYWMSATGHGGPVLSHGLLKRIAEVEADLDFDFYCAE